MTELTDKDIMIAMLITDGKSIEEAKRIANIVTEYRATTIFDFDSFFTEDAETKKSEGEKLDDYILMLEGSIVEEKEKEETNNKVEELTGRLFNKKMNLKETIEYCDAKIESSKNIIAKCEAKKCKKSKGSVYVGTELDGGEYSFDYINNKRKRETIKNNNEIIAEYEAFKIRVENI